jgi:hypothetical protein
VEQKCKNNISGRYILLTIQTGSTQKTVLGKAFNIGCALHENGILESKGVNS